MSNEDWAAMPQRIITSNPAYDEIRNAALDEVAEFLRSVADSRRPGSAEWVLLYNLESHVVEKMRYPMGATP